MLRLSCNSEEGLLEFGQGALLVLVDRLQRLRFLRQGIELFDVASKCSMRWISKCSRGVPPHLQHSRISTSSHTSGKPFVLRYRPPRPLPQNPVWAGFIFSLGASTLRPHALHRSHAGGLRDLEARLGGHEEGRDPGDRPGPESPQTLCLGISVF